MVAKILVATDGPRASETALEYAVELAKYMNAGSSF